VQLVLFRGRGNRGGRRLACSVLMNEVSGKDELVQGRRDVRREVESKLGERGA
jgi:hypothetical protein